MSLDFDPSDRGLIAVGGPRLHDGPDYRMQPDYPIEDRHSKKKSRYQQSSRNQLPKPALRELFAHFARFGDPHSTGHHITLAQTDKWFRQAGIVDNWNVTATDTAISYRKVSRWDFTTS